MTRDPDDPSQDESAALATAQLYREIAFIRALLDDKVDARHREMLDASELVKEKLQAISQRIDMIEAARVEYKADTKDRVDAALAAQQRAIDAALDAVTTANSIQTESLKTEFHEHLVQYRRETDMAFDAAHKATEAALASTDKATTKAEVANERRFESVNEFRAQLADIIRTLITRVEHDAEIKGITQLLAERTKEIAGLSDRVLGIEKEKQGGVDMRVAIFAIISLGILVFTVLAANGVFNR